MDKKDIKRIQNKIKENSKSSFKQALKTVFAKNNMWYLAIGMIIGSAITAVINSLANDIIMSAIANAFGLHDISELSHGAIKYGQFIGSILSLIILAITMLVIVFTFVFIYNSVKKKYKATSVDEIKKIKEPSVQESILAELKKMNDKLDK